MTRDAAAISRHNEVQRGYFERALKPTMVPTNSPYIRRHVDEVLAMAQITSSDRVLEVGCGMGRYTLPLAERGISIEGLDLSPVLLERLSEYAANRYTIPLHCTDIASHPPQLAERFDVIIGFFMLHHLHDLELSFRGVYRLLKPGGRVVFLEPNAWNPLYYVQVALSPGMTWEGDRGIVKMRRGVVRDAMTRAGLARFELERFGFFPPIVANTRTGQRIERALERIPIWRPMLPFQLFYGEKS